MKQPSHSATSDNGSTTSIQLTARRSGMEPGRDQPEHIDEFRDENAGGDLPERSSSALDGAEQQEQERHGEVEHDEPETRQTASHRAAG